MTSLPRGIVHRDLKSPNILLTSESTVEGDTISGVKVVDFGLAGQVCACPYAYVHIHMHMRMRMHMYMYMYMYMGIQMGMDMGIDMGIDMDMCIRAPSTCTLAS